MVAITPNLGWVNLAVRAELERRLPGKRVFLENDVRAAALGEHVLGAGRGYDSMLAVFVGSGVGGGIVIDGKLYHGAQGGAGEIGHMVIRAARAALRLRPRRLPGGDGRARRGHALRHPATSPRPHRPS